jgi:hypothetical protein
VFDKDKGLREKEKPFSLKPLFLIFFPRSPPFSKRSEGGDNQEGFDSEK